MVFDLGLKVHKTLGPGLLESVYEECLVRELIENNISGIVPNNLFELTIESEAKASGTIVFAVPKSVDTLNPLFLMRDQSKPVVKDYYFLLDW